jgi:hypothetical protein
MCVVVVERNFGVSHTAYYGPHELAGLLDCCQDCLGEIFRIWCVFGTATALGSAAA